MVVVVVMMMAVRMVLAVTVPGAGDEMLNNAWLVDPGCMVSVCVWMAEMTVCTNLPVDL